MVDCYALIEDVPPDELAKRAEAFMKKQSG
jgi:hypothetical protein